MWIRFRSAHIPIGQGEMVIGRGAYCSIAIVAERVSREHARLVLRGAKLTVEDLGSANGTFVNGERIECERALAMGDRIGIGDEELEVTRDPVDPRADTKTMVE